MSSSVAKCMQLYRASCAVSLDVTLNFNDDDDERKDDDNVHASTAVLSSRVPNDVFHYSGEHGASNTTGPSTVVSLD